MCVVAHGGGSQPLGAINSSIRAGSAFGARRSRTARVSGSADAAVDAMVLRAFQSSAVGLQIGDSGALLAAEARNCSCTWRLGPAAVRVSGSGRGVGSYAKRVGHVSRLGRVQARLHVWPRMP